MSTRIDTVHLGITNAYLLRDRGTVLVDPGGSGRIQTAPFGVVSLLGTPPKLDLIVATHGHFDHFGSSVRLRESTGAPLAIHRADSTWLVEGKVVWPKGVTKWGKFIRNVIAPLMLPWIHVPRVVPDLLIGDEGLDLRPYGVEGGVVHTPGHSPGSVSVVLTSGEAFVGDLAMNGAPLCLRPSLGIFADDPELVRASWSKLLGLGARTIYPAHGRPFPASALHL